MPEKYDSLRLDSQLCFPLYACAKEIVRRYTPFLDEIGLTYTQYIAMMALWEHRRMNVKTLGALLYLDSGTLTPVLKKLEQKGLITRARSHEDERFLDVTLTDGGLRLRGKAAVMPGKMASCVPLTPEEGAQLYALLRKALGAMSRE